MFKSIRVVPEDIIDIVLSKTQRKTPTEIHANFQISRIRKFYMTKVKFTSQEFVERIDVILTDFPKLEDIHPFYSDLLNVLYDKDHYKLALGHLNLTKNKVIAIGKEYVKLLKYADSLYRAKMLKRAALGRMVTMVKKQKKALVYLEQVRQHMGRLPSIDPTTRTLIVCGYPNVGKSSFMNKVSRAEVEVQPYAFTTKALYVGHFDFNYLRWQVIDTPGILDHPLEDRNTIEMQSITALAHIRSCIMYFVDLSEQCGYSIKDQCNLFNSIKPLFANKPTMIVCSKSDLRSLSSLEPEEMACFKEAFEGYLINSLSSMTEDNVIGVRNGACDMLLAQRLEQKFLKNKADSILDKLNVALPLKRDEVVRAATIPRAVLEKTTQNLPLYDYSDPNRRILERDLELQNGGTGVYSVDLNKKYILEMEDWKYDQIPEIMDGRNVADFVDADIEKKLLALEQEEEAMHASGQYKISLKNPVAKQLRFIASNIRDRKHVSTQMHKLTRQTFKATRSKPKRRPTDMDLDSENNESNDGSDNGSTNDAVMGDVLDLQKHKELKEIKLGIIQKANIDRKIFSKMPKYLFSGKRGFKADRR
eukprot:NODE_70_length_23697_cov_0.294771.p4 type:complete len:590 gc:universal NODE_70_length_23697_cov_0.294771:8376-6607(-)